MTEALIRVAILDDHEYIVHSLERLLDEEPDLEVVVASTDAEDFLDRVSRTRPNIAVVDLQLHGNLLGHRVVEELTRAGVLCLAFTADQRPVPVRLAMRAGARGLVLKADPIDQLATAIRAVRETGWAPSSATATGAAISSGARSQAVMRRIRSAGPPSRSNTAMRIAPNPCAASHSASTPTAAPPRSVTSIAIDLGYAGTSAFSYMFHQATGCTPSQWRSRRAAG